MSNAVDIVLDNANNALYKDYPDVPRIYYVPSYYESEQEHWKYKNILSSYSTAAYDLAVAWRATGNVVYRDKMVELLNIWAINNVYVSDKGDSVLVYAYKGSMLFDALKISGISVIDNDQLSDFIWWSSNLYIPSITYEKNTCRWKSNIYTWLLYSLIISNYITDNENTVELFDEMDIHINDQRIKGFSIFGNRDELWRENLRNNSWMWYTYFCLAPATYAAYIAKSSFNIDIWVSLLPALDKYFYYASGEIDLPEGFPYKKYDGIIGNLQHRLFSSSDEFIFHTGDNICEACGHILSNHDWTGFVKHKRPVVNGNVWRHSTALRELCII